MPRYAMMVRVSTDKQDTEAQRRACENEMVRRGIDLKNVLMFDEDVQTTKAELKDRPVVQKMLKTLRRGDTLFVYKINRLARTGTDVVSLYDKLVTQRKVNLISVQEPDLRKLIFFLAGVGEWERNNISEQTTMKLHDKIRNGELVGKPPYGWMVDPTKLQLHRENVPSYGKPYLLIENPEEQINVKQILELRKQNLSFNSIAKQTKKMGLKNRANGWFNATQIHRIITRHKEPMSPLGSV